MKSNSLSSKLTIVLCTIAALISIIMAMVVYGIFSDKSKQEYDQKADGYIQTLTTHLEIPLWNYNRELITQICSSLSGQREITTLVVKDHIGNAIFQYGDETVPGQMMRRSQILHSNLKAGQITIGLDEAVYQKQNRDILWTVLLTMLTVITGLSVATRLVIQYLLQDSLAHFLEIIKRFAAGEYNDFDETAYRYTEFAEIWDNFKLMGERIDARETELKAANLNLTYESHKKEAAARALKESEAKYRNIFNNLHDVYCEATLLPDIRFIEVSPSVEKILGYTREELIGKSPLHFIKNKDLVPEMEAAIREYGVVESIEVTVYHKNGEPVPVSVSSSFQIDDQGNEIKTITMIRDMRTLEAARKERQELEKQLFQAQKMETIGLLASGIAHDFNNILFGMLGFAELLGDAEEANVSKKQISEWAAYITEGGMRGKELVAQILAFARADEEEIHPVKPASVVKEAVKLLNASLPSTIEITLNCETKARVLGEVTKIHQLIMNLCTNSAYAMKEKGGKLTISLEETRSGSQMRPRIPGNSPGKYICLCVEDTGCGMDEQTLEKIMDPFYTTKPKGEGTGMGLSIVNGIIKNMGGFLNIHSRKGEGSRFDVYMPLFETESAREMKKEQGPADPLTGSERILFVDDEKTLTRLATEFFTDMGYGVKAFNSSVKALADFKENHSAYDLVITDMTMPELTGEMLLKEIRVISTGIPVILISGNLSIEEEQNLKPFDLALKKPVPIKELARAVRRILDGKQRRPGSELNPVPLEQPWADPGYHPHG